MQDASQEGPVVVVAPTPMSSEMSAADLKVRSPGIARDRMADAAREARTLSVPCRAFVALWLTLLPYPLPFAVT